LVVNSGFGFSLGNDGILGYSNGFYPSAISIVLLHAAAEN